MSTDPVKPVVESSLYHESSQFPENENSRERATADDRSSPRPLKGSETKGEPEKLQANLKDSQDESNKEGTKRSHDEMMYQDSMGSEAAGADQQLLGGTNLNHLFGLPVPNFQSLDSVSQKTELSSSKPLDTNGPTREEFSRMSRSERKRYREKKRRSDVNKGFDELLTILLNVDPAVRAEVERNERCRKSQKTSGGHDGDNSGLNRVDLISRTTAALDRIYKENLEQKALLSQLTKQKGDENEDAARQAIKDNRVLLMIPFLMPSGPAQPRSAGTASHLPVSHPGPGGRASDMGQNHVLNPHVGAMGEGAALSTGFPHAGGYHTQMSGAMGGYGTHSRGYARGDSSFQPALAQRYFRSMYDANVATGNAMDPTRQGNIMEQRGRGRMI